MYSVNHATVAWAPASSPRHTSSVRSASSSSRTSASVLKYATETRIPIAAAEALLSRIPLTNVHSATPSGQAMSMSQEVLPGVEDLSGSISDVDPRSDQSAAGLNRCRKERPQALHQR